MVSKFFIITCFLLLILIKETKAWNIRPHGKFFILIFSNWIGVLPVYPKLCIGADASYSQASKYLIKQVVEKWRHFLFYWNLQVYQSCLKNMQCLYGKADSDATFCDISCLMNKKNRYHIFKLILHKIHSRFFTKKVCKRN